MHILLATMLLALVCAAPVAAQSRGDCAGQLDSLLTKQLTVSGLIVKIVEMETFIEALLIQDARSGCQFTALEALLDEKCKPGRSISITGTLKRSALTKGYEIDRGDNPSEATLTCW